ncbi:class II fructose-bisphosphate aldolase [Streptomyces sp. SID13726]|uniref:class II fructose-bisphosphate aldolase n=1 Tax=Streptomyces sp. SID13726 TaxID=2706058 RepID=UPI001EF39CAE|nr:class II fructose-bisphosphate aldolase [Streptomyces sp. SID13726]
MPLHGTGALKRLALDTAEHSPAPLGVHLDHSRDLDEITACLEVSHTSVMVDGSHLPFAENIALTKDAVRRARAHGAWVEGELGALPGDEDVSVWSPGWDAVRDPALKVVGRLSPDAEGGTA